MSQVRRIRPRHVDRRRVLRQGAGWALLGLLATSGAVWTRAQPDAATAPIRPLDVRGFGARGDGVSDDAPAIQRAINAAGMSERPLVFPAGTYLAGAVLHGVSNLTIAGHGATIKTTNTARDGPTLDLFNVHDVAIHGLAIDGNRDAFGFTTEQKHAIRCRGVRDVTIVDCHLYRCKGDGLLFEGDIPPRHNVNVTVEGTMCRANYRQGCSIVDLAHGRFTACTFSDTMGTVPESGVDIEPWRADQVIDDIEFSDCTFRNNQRHGLLVWLDAAPTAIQANIRLINCSVVDNEDGVLLRHARSVTFEDCVIRANRGRGVLIFNSGRDVHFDGGVISENGAHGLEAVATPEETFSGLALRDVEVRHNSLLQPGRYDGIHLRNALDGVVVDHCTITGSHRYGISATDQVRRLHLADNALEGNLDGPTNVLASEDAGAASGTSRVSSWARRSAIPTTHR